MAYSPSSRKTTPMTQTRDLAFFQINMGQDIETNYADSNSIYHKAVMALQTKLELYGVGEPNGSWFTVIASAKTAPFAEGERNADKNVNTILRDLLESVIDSNITVFNTRLNGDTLENNC